MIQGEVNHKLEAVVVLEVFDKNGTTSRIDAIIDTGFSQQLNLPQVWVDAHQFERIASAEATLADGDRRTVDVYEGFLRWDGQERVVAIQCLGNDALIGMKLLKEHLLAIDVVPRGPWTITAKDTSSTLP